MPEDKVEVLKALFTKFELEHLPCVRDGVHGTDFTNAVTRDLAKLKDGVNAVVVELLALRAQADLAVSVPDAEAHGPPTPNNTGVVTSAPDVTPLPWTLEDGEK